MRIASIYSLFLLLATCAIAGPVDSTYVTTATWGLSDALSALTDGEMLLADTTGIAGPSVQTPQLATDILIQGPRSLSTTW